MATTIHKYPLNAPSSTALSLPVGAIVRHVATQGGVPTLWIEHAAAEYLAEYESRTFTAFGTGHPIVGDLEYVGSVTGVDGWLVFHIFERLS